MSEWENYQEAAAAYFRSLGLKATVEHQIEGARGLHELDVYVEGSYLGIPFKWVVECKAWKSNVPKEKVMALASILQDIGADRGFLLSEKGFQSGAIRAATKTNITLTSLSDLSSATDDHVVDAIVGRLHWRLSKAQSRLRDIKKQKFDDGFYPPTAEPLGKLFLLDLSFADALKSDYPIIYLVDGDGRHQANTLEELVKAADALISYAENWTPPA